MNHGFTMNEKNGVVYLSVPSFDATGICTTCFTTRLGGVSKPPLESMNLGFGRGDDRACVVENYRIIGDAAGFLGEDTVAFSQVHRNDVCVADESFRGEAFAEEKRKYDAVITACKNLPIGTYHADCVPVFLLDPEKKVCGVAHAGWRGTALKTPKSAVSKMCEVFGCNPQSILAAIGPAISKCCFETHSDVPDAMKEAFGESAASCIEQKKDGKFNVDLIKLNLLSLLEAGIKDENITLSGECTCCTSDIYWSHRKTGGVRGAMMAIIMLK